MRTLCFLLALSFLCHPLSTIGQDRSPNDRPHIEYMDDIPEGLWMPLVDHIEGELNALSTQRGLTTTITRESIPDYFLLTTFGFFSLSVLGSNPVLAIPSFLIATSTGLGGVIHMRLKNLVELHYNLGRGETLYFVGSCYFSSRWSLAEEVTTGDDPYLIVDYVVSNCHHDVNYLPDNIPLPNGGHGAVAGILSFSHNDLRELMVSPDAIDHAIRGLSFFSGFKLPQWRIAQ